MSTHQVSCPCTAKKFIAELNGRPSTWRSKVGVEAIEEPCTKSPVHFLSPGPFEGAPTYFSQRKIFTSSPLFGQCSSPTTSFSVACAVIYGTFLACIRLLAPVAPPPLIVTPGLDPRLQGQCSRPRPGPRPAPAPPTRPTAPYGTGLTQPI